MQPIRNPDGLHRFNPPDAKKTIPLTRVKTLLWCERFFLIRPIFKIANGITGLLSHLIIRLFYQVTVLFTGGSSRPKKDTDWFKLLFSTQLPNQKKEQGI